MLAPMAGVTDSPFRILMRELGAGVLISELVSCQGIVRRAKKTLDMLRFSDRERPLGLQIFGDDSFSLAQAAGEVERLGADFVDLNLGCPVPKVVKKGGGVAWMRSPSKLEAMVRMVRRAVAIPVTVKMRAGWDDAERNAPDCTKAVSEAGVAWVAIHGRTRAQGYQGKADWELIARCKQVSGVPVVGNGDIMTAEGALERLSTSGCDGVMIGRGILRDPWLFARIRALRSGGSSRDVRGDFVSLLRRHRQLLEEAGGGRTAAMHLRKFAAWYSHGYPRSAPFRRQIFLVPTLDDVESLAVSFFESVRHLDVEDKESLFFMSSGHG